MKKISAILLLAGMFGLSMVAVPKAKSQSGYHKHCGITVSCRYGVDNSNGPDSDCIYTTGVVVWCQDTQESEYCYNDTLSYTCYGLKGMNTRCQYNYYGCQF